ncbi:MAG: type II secretion system F family protein [Patescibacteria group bacterium]
MNFSAQIPLLSHVSFLDKLLFTKHMGIMLKSGITIIDALHILASQTRSATFRDMLEGVAKSIENGQTLANALGKFSRVFDAFYVNIIKIGEDSGTLDQSFAYLGEQLGKDYAFRKKIQGALLYPIIVFTGAMIVGIGISLFVLPQLLELFKGFDVELPWTTQLLLWFAELMKNFGVIVVIWLFVVLVTGRLVTQLSVVKPLWHRFLLSLPILGNIIQNTELSSFSRNMGIMLKSGMPINTAMEIESHMTQNLVFQKYGENLLSSIDRGKSLAKELETGKYPKIPLIAVKMLSVGETTGKLDETFAYLADFFEEEVDDATKNISTIFEPIMLIFIGLIVAFVAMAIISPIYELTGNIKK